jgi:hypothetical protein
MQETTDSNDELKDLPKQEPADPIQENTAAEPELQTSNFKPETNAMETHAHHLHKAPAQGWKHYFFEFLMLFLAVTLGYFVENQREHYVEHLRAKEFATSLVRDLQNDTNAINVHMRTARIYMNVTDSLLSLSRQKLEGRAAAQFSFYTRFVYWTAPIIWNRATFEQIKNSGGLRYFKNYELLDKLMKYDISINVIEAESANNEVRGNMLLNSINEIIEPDIHHELSKNMLLAVDTMSNATKENYLSAKVGTLEDKRTEIRKMLNMIIVQQRNLRINDARQQRTKELAAELISEFKKEYHIEISYMPDSTLPHR